MKIITVIAGILLTVLGVFSVANAGLSFLSLAFPIGVCLVLVGLVECFVYKRIREDVDAGHWVLIEGLTTFILGVVVLTGRLAADIAVPVVFGMWSIVSGIRGFTVLAFETDTREKNIDFYWALCQRVEFGSRYLYIFQFLHAAAVGFDDSGYLLRGSGSQCN